MIATLYGWLFIKEGDYVKYINTLTGVIWENDDVEEVLQLIKNKPNFALYEEPKEETVDESKPQGITKYIPKPKSKPKK